MSVPMVDLKVQYQAIKEEIDNAVLGVIQSTHFILGPHGKALEEAIAAYHGVKHAVAVASGTDALHLALLAAGIKRGDEVITTPFTFIATAEAISYVGGVPVFVDIDPVTFNLDVGKVEAAITSKTKGIIPVHLYGQPADMDPLMQMARKARAQGHRGLRPVLWSGVQGQKRPAPWAISAASASSRARTWAATATAAWSSPMTPGLPSICRA